MYRLPVIIQCDWKSYKHTCLIFYEAGADGNGYSSQEMILFLDELKESSNYYILKNIECQKKSNQNKGAAMLNE